MIVFPRKKILLIFWWIQFLWLISTFLIPIFDFSVIYRARVLMNNFKTFHCYEDVIKYTRKFLSVKNSDTNKELISAWNLTKKATHWRNNGTSNNVIMWSNSEKIRNARNSIKTRQKCSEYFVGIPIHPFAFSESGTCARIPVEECFYISKYKHYSMKNFTSDL